MMKKHKQPIGSLAAAGQRRSSGFSLVELMVAIGIFMVVGGVAVTLVRKHQLLFVNSQNQAAVNIALRNSVAQIQSDVVNAGSGYYPGASMPFWPVGITAVPVPQAAVKACRAAQTYTPACFDTLTILTADPTMPAAQPSSSADGLQKFTVGVNTTLYLVYNTNPAPTSAQMTQFANSFAVGNEILIVQGGTDTPQIVPLIVGSTGTATGNVVQLTVSGAPTDNLNIMDTGDASLFKQVVFGPGAPAASASDYVIRLDATTYSVNANNQLVRQTNGGIADPIANGIVGFEVQEFANGGWSQMQKPADWSQIRAVQVQLVARTASSPDLRSFANSFDGGPYQVQGISVVINPRNLSMNN